MKSILIHKEKVNSSVANNHSKAIAAHSKSELQFMDKRPESMSQKQIQRMAKTFLADNATKTFKQNNGKSVIQRYVDPNDGFKYSDNERYAVRKDNSNFIYVKVGASPPQPKNSFTPGSAINGWIPTTYNKVFLNDCLNFAEMVARKSDNALTEPQFVADGADVGHNQSLLFGHSKKQNLSIAKDHPNFNKGKNADPQINEAFVITRSAAAKVGETPYHVALVIAQDGSDKVTIEADAGQARLNPIFDMYGSKKGQSFHEQYKGIYGDVSHPAKTGKLSLRA